MLWDTNIVPRTDADAANLLTSDIDQEMHHHRRKNRRRIFYVNCGVEQGIDRGLSYAPYADLIWMETSNPDLDYARKFAEEFTQNSRKNVGIQLFSII
jgi:isocitrate lyase